MGCTLRERPTKPKGFAKIQEFESQIYIIKNQRIKRRIKGKDLSCQPRAKEI